MSDRLDIELRAFSQALAASAPPPPPLQRQRLAQAKRSRFIRRSCLLGAIGVAVVAAVLSVTGRTMDARIQTVHSGSTAATNTTSAVYGAAPTSSAMNPGTIALTPDLVAEVEKALWRIGSITMNGAAYAHSLIVTPVAAEGARLEVNLGRDHVRFVGDIGVPDEQQSATAFRVEISLDNGTPAFSAVVRFGETRTIDLDVTNALRLRFSITKLGGSSEQCCSLAVGNPRFHR